MVTHIQFEINIQKYLKGQLDKDEKEELMGNFIRFYNDLLVYLQEARQWKKKTMNGQQ